MQQPGTALRTVSSLLPQKRTAWEASATHEDSYGASQIDSGSILRNCSSDLGRGLGQLPTAGLIEDCLDPMGMAFHDSTNFHVDDWSDIHVLLGAQVCVKGENTGIQSCCHWKVKELKTPKLTSFRDVCKKHPCQAFQIYTILSSHQLLDESFNGLFWRQTLQGICVPYQAALHLVYL
jgi:hypothetical protein